MVNLANVSNASSLYNIASYTNDNVGGLLFDGGMVVFFVILLFVSRRFNYPLEYSFAVAGWVCFLASAFFWYSALVSGVLVFLFLAVAAFSSLYIYGQGR